MLVDALGLSLQPPTPVASPSPPMAESPSQNVTAVGSKERHQLYHLKLIPTICIAIAAMAVLLLVVMVLLIRRKSRELKGSKAPTGASSWDAFPLTVRKFHEGLTAFLSLFCH